jgi:hypothetical protein
MFNKFSSLLFVLILFTEPLFSQEWQNVTASFGTLPSGITIFKTTDPVAGRPFIAYIAEIDLKNKALDFITDTSFGRRLTPQTFFAKNDNPYIVVNGTFFDFATNRNLNAVVMNHKLVSFNVHDQVVRGKDSIHIWHTTRSALGIYKNRSADIAWLFTDSSLTRAKAFQLPPKPWRDTITHHKLPFWETKYSQRARSWKVETAIGGGPVLVQDGKMMITNNDERMFSGKAIQDLHPRTAMGYTSDGKLLILAVEGRNPKIAEGASLIDMAEILVKWGCKEALNLDGGGSSCLLVNGKQTIKPSDKEGQRAVPAVFIVAKK